MARFGLSFFCSIGSGFTITFLISGFLIAVGFGAAFNKGNRPSNLSRLSYSQSMHKSFPLSSTQKECDSFPHREHTSRVFDVIRDIASIVQLHRASSLRMRDDIEHYPDNVEIFPFLPGYVNQHEGFEEGKETL